MKLRAASARKMVFAGCLCAWWGWFGVRHALNATSKDELITLALRGLQYREQAVFPLSATYLETEFQRNSPAQPPPPGEELEYGHAVSLVRLTGDGTRWLVERRTLRFSKNASDLLRAHGAEGFDGESYWSIDGERRACYLRTNPDGLFGTTAMLTGMELIVPIKELELLKEVYDAEMEAVEPEHRKLRLSFHRWKSPLGHLASSEVVLLVDRGFAVEKAMSWGNNGVRGWGSRLVCSDFRKVRPQVWLPARVLRQHYQGPVGALTLGMERQSELLELTTEPREASMYQFRAPLGYTVADRINDEWHDLDPRIVAALRDFDRARPEGPTINPRGMGERATGQGVR